MFASSKVVHLQASYSDHDPIMLATNADTQIACKKKIPKRFEEKWVTHPECEGIIHEAWNGEISMGSPTYRLFEKSRRVVWLWWDGVHN